MNNDLAVSILDVDNFGVVNSIFGLDIGDALLRSIGRQVRRWATTVRERSGLEPLFCRYGGEEFALRLRCERSQALALAGEALHCIESIRIEAEADRCIVRDHDGVVLEVDRQVISRPGLTDIMKAPASLKTTLSTQNRSAYCKIDDYLDSSQAPNSRQLWQVTASAGLAVLSELTSVALSKTPDWRVETYRKLMGQAEERLKTAKRSGRGRLM